MRTFCALALVVWLGGAATADEKDNKKALEELQGTYQIIGLERDGRKITEDELKKLPDPKVLQVVIKDDQLISNLSGKGTPAALKLDAAKNPPHLDISTVKDGKTLTDHGIYKLKDGVLTICAAMNSEPKDRPTEFKIGEKIVILTLKKTGK